MAPEAAEPPVTCVLPTACANRLADLAFSCVHLGVGYARWAGAYGDADILAKTAGEPTVYLKAGPMGRAGTSNPRTSTRTSDVPAHITVPLDDIAQDAGELHLAARSIAADLLADYGQPDNRLLKPDGSIAFGLLEPGYQDPLRNWTMKAFTD